MGASIGEARVNTYHVKLDLQDARGRCTKHVSLTLVCKHCNKKPCGSGFIVIATVHYYVAWSLETLKIKDNFSKPHLQFIEWVKYRTTLYSNEASPFI